jgi:hypothetical protein
MQLTKAEQKLDEWQTAVEILLGAAEGRDFAMHARITWDAPCRLARPPAITQRDLRRAAKQKPILPSCYLT